MSGQDKSKDPVNEQLVYSYPYHPQYYNPHVRYVSPSSIPPDSPEAPKKKSIVFTYSQVGNSQVKSQVKGKD